MALSIKLNTFIKQNQPKSIPITPDQIYSVYPAVGGRLPEHYLSKTLQYSARVKDGCVVYTARHPINSWGRYDILKKFCELLDAPYILRVPLPEPIVTMPRPWWADVDEEDDPGQITMFKSEALAALEAYYLEAKEQLAAAC